MADGSKDSDQSMEDILQSIKRIIADEGDTSSTAIAGSDVLELTDLLAEDVAVSAPIASPAPEPHQVANMSIDEIMAGPISSMPPVVIQKPEPEPEPEPEPIVMQEPEKIEPVFEPEAAITHVAAPVTEDNDRLMSDATLAASVAALHTLSHSASAQPHHHAGPAFRSAPTVEDLVLESIRPMLKEWLDSNLPSMVQHLVEKEIRRLSGA